MATILLIDDDVDLVEMNAAVLAHRGHEVLRAYSAADARRKLAAGPAPDVVVLDVMMEDVGGLRAGQGNPREAPASCR